MKTKVKHETITYSNINNLVLSSSYLHTYLGLDN